MTSTPTSTAHHRIPLAVRKSRARRLVLATDRNVVTKGRGRWFGLF